MVPNNILDSKDIVSDILSVRGSPVDLPSSFRFEPGHFSRGEINDILNFGFSYIEQKDQLVSYVLADPVMMKSIIVGIPESTIEPRNESIGELWTAKLVVSKKVKPSHIVFYADDYTVLNLNINPDTDEIE